MMTKTSKTKTENLITKKNLIKSFGVHFKWNFHGIMNVR